MHYHGGSRGSQLGAYTSKTKAVKAWQAFLKDDDEIRDEIEKLNGDYGVYGPKLLKFKIDQTPTDVWPDVEVRDVDWNENTESVKK